MGAYPANDYSALSMKASAIALLRGIDTLHRIFSRVISVVMNALRGSCEKVAGAEEESLITSVLFAPFPCH